MKKSIIIVFGTFCFALQAQVKIGGADASLSSTSVDLELAETDKGLVLPYVSSTADADASGAVPGTLIFDVSENKLKIKKAAEWQDFTINEDGAIDTQSQDGLEESLDAAVRLGSNATGDATPGVLVLTSPDKGMIIPQVTDPDLNVKSPAAGMMVYDPSTHKLCVYNGTRWTFWMGTSE